MVRQFADRYAFLRELVQNGIDAGSRRIEIRLEREGDGHVLTSLADDGSGMGRAVIEGPLLTLFSSSKEKDTTKIGKYGIGFVSVFAVEPEHVDVLTRTPTESWRVRLFGDHSYELSAVDRTAGVGTTVTLVHSEMSAEDFGAHVERSLAALTKWCRHARVPIEVVVFDSSDPSATRTVQINEPMHVPGLVAVSGRLATEDLTVVASVGYVEVGGGPFVGFYNRGLTLFEATDAVHDEHEDLRGINFKVDSPRLSHTLSRDTIKRDDAYHSVLRHVIELVRGPLLKKVEETINECARSAGGGNPTELTALYLALMVPAFRSLRDPSRVEVPLTEMVKGRSTMSVQAVVKASENKEVLISEQATSMTRAIATLNGGRPVVKHVELGGILRSLVKGATVENVERVFAHAKAVNDEETAISPILKTLLCAIGRNVGAVCFAHFDGVLPNETFRVVPQITNEAITRPTMAEPSARAWGKNATLFLNREDAAVRLARRRARTDPEAAAHLLLRVLLVTDGAIEAKLVDRLIEAAAAASER